MREILFRGKDNGVLNGTWQYGSLDIAHPDAPQIVRLDRYNNKMGVPILIETVGQYTGLLDKNGKKIFEGDIITDCDGSVFFVKYFGDGGYPAFDISPEIETVECNCLSFLNALDCLEVIGNIHDNPELLKGGE